MLASSRQLANALCVSWQVNCLHPGVVRTELGRYMVNESNRLFMVGVPLDFSEFPLPRRFTAYS